MATEIKKFLPTWPKWKRRIFFLITHSTLVYSICLALSTKFFILKTILTFFFSLVLLYYNYYYYYYLSINLFNIFVYLFIYFSIYLFTYLFYICFNGNRTSGATFFILFFNSLCACVHSIFINHHPSFLISSFHPSIGGDFKTLSSSGLVYPYLSIVWVSRLR